MLAFHVFVLCVSEGSLPDPCPDRSPREAGGEGRLSAPVQGGGERVGSRASDGRPRRAKKALVSQRENTRKRDTLELRVAGKRLHSGTIVGEVFSRDATC